jgi:hypothetical protein
MRLFQTVLFCLVLSANVYWKLTPNPYLAAIIAFIIVLFATLAVVEAKERWTARCGKKAWQESRRN